jgi:hypothetical protein
MFSVAREGTSTRSAILAAVVLGIVVLVGGLALASGNDTTQSGRCLNGAAAEQFVRPGVSVDVGDSWWPLGTRCVYHYADGSSAESVRAISTSTLTAIVVIAMLAASVPVGLVIGARRLMRR